MDLCFIQALEGNEMSGIEYTKEKKMAYITINSPVTMNALGSEVRDGLKKAFRKVKDDDEVWAAIITGAGEKAFSSGADIKEFLNKKAESKSRQVVLRPDTIWKPFIAAIHGYCLGGGLELALTCDIRIASKDAVFGLPEVNIGTMVGFGGAIRLPKLIPSAIAAEMLLSGNRIDAAEAYRVGLISRIVSKDHLMQVAREIAETIISRGPLAVRATKELMITAQNMTLENALARNRELIAYLATTEDYAEGARAFAEKRLPHFKAH
jgi:enoyl-CoA hydratase/carnithine racemase